MEPRKSTSVALLDIDNNLIFDGTIQNLSPHDVNLTQLEALEVMGIKDLYLFSSMGAAAFEIAQRIQLIEILEKRGFNVLGVITDPDPGCGIECDEKKNYINVSQANQNPNTEEAALRDYIRSKVISQYQKKPYDFPLGESYENSKKKFPGKDAYKDPNYLAYMQKVSIDGRITGMLAEDRNYVANGGKKGVMYEMFMSFNLDPDDGPHYDHVVVIDDDKKNNLISVQAAHDRYFSQSNVKLTCVYCVSQKKSLDSYLDDLGVGIEQKANHNIAAILNGLNNKYPNNPQLKELKDIYFSMRENNLGSAMMYIQNKAGEFLEEKNKFNLFKKNDPDDVVKFYKALVKMKNNNYNDIVNFMPDRPKTSAPTYK